MEILRKIKLRFSGFDSDQLRTLSFMKYKMACSRSEVLLDVPVFVHSKKQLCCHLVGVLRNLF